MLSDILKALQMVLDAVKGYQAPDKKRQEVGKRLATLCADIDEIVKNGWEILLSFESSRTIKLDKLRIQQRAINKTIKDFKHPSVKRLLSIHLPTFSSLKVIFEPKSAELGFLISQLTNGRRLSRREREELEYRLIDEEDLSFDHPSLFHLTFAPYQSVDRTPSRIAWLFPPFLLLNWLFRRKNDGRGEATVGLFALKEHIIEAGQVLTQIKDSNEELRLLLVNKFKLEDIV